MEHPVEIHKLWVPVTAGGRSGSGGGLHRKKPAIKWQQTKVFCQRLWVCRWGWALKVGAPLSSWQLGQICHKEAHLPAHPADSLVLKWRVGVGLPLGERTRQIGVLARVTGPGAGHKWRVRRTTSLFCPAPEHDLSPPHPRDGGEGLMQEACCEVWARLDHTGRFCLNKIKTS